MGVGGIITAIDTHYIFTSYKDIGLIRRIIADIVNT